METLSEKRLSRGMTSFGTTLALVTATASATVGGVLFGFSTLVMPALRVRPAAEAVAAMQQINLVAPRSLLMVPLLASALGCLLVGLHALVTGPAGRGWLLFGAVAGLASMAITAGYHIPHNNALALVDPRSAAAAATWPGWAAGWTALNAVRAAAALFSGIALVVGAWRRR